MALGAILAAALTDHSSRSYSLWIDGLDVIREPAAPSRYGVPYDSIEINDIGPGGVGSMTFDVEDPLRVLTITEGQYVRFHNWIGSGAVNWTMFAGYVDRVTMRTDFGTGRMFAVSVTGVAAILDWELVPTSTPAFPAGTFARDAVMGAAAAAGTFLLANVGNTVGVGTINLGANLELAAAVDVSGMTLRRAISTIGANLRDSGGGSPDISLLATVDPMLDLVVWRDTTGGTLNAPWYSGPGSIIDTVGLSNPKPNRLAMTRDGAAKIRAVFVVGGNAAGTGWVYDGSGLVGPTAKLNNPLSTTAALRDQIGASYLALSSVAIRGTVDLEWKIAGPFLQSNQYAGGTFQLTDTSTGQATAAYRVMTTRHRFGAGGLTGTAAYTFGAMAPSSARLTRRLTRDTLS